MKAYKPSTPFNVPMSLMIPTYSTAKGVKTKTYPEEGIIIFGSFRRFGGSERIVNNTTVIEDTAVIETWFRPDITSDCRLIINGIPYDIEATPENINMQNQFLQIRVKAVKGGA